MGHRYNVIHLFFSKSSEETRGYPWFSPALKFFRDLNDYLDAELVSNIVTAAFSMFIEVGEVDTEYPSLNFGNIDETTYLADGTQKTQRYEELVPGTVSYLNAGEKPFTVSAQRWLAERVVIGPAARGDIRAFYWGYRKSHFNVSWNAPSGII